MKKVILSIMLVLAASQLFIGGCVNPDDGSKITVQTSNADAQKKSTEIFACMGRIQKEETVNGVTNWVRANARYSAECK